MFEKEAEEYYDTTAPIISEISNLDFENGIKLAFKDGVEFGYEKGQSDQLVHKQYQLNQLRKANEWHYNGVPENENDILCQIDKDMFVVGYFHQKNKQYYTTSGEWLETVIAWKEIVLPKESE